MDPLFKPVKDVPPFFFSQKVADNATLNLTTDHKTPSTKLDLFVKPKSVYAPASIHVSIPDAKSVTLKTSSSFNLPGAMKLKLDTDIPVTSPALASSSTSIRVPVGPAHCGVTVKSSTRDVTVLPSIQAGLFGVKVGAQTSVPLIGAKKGETMVGDAMANGLVTLRQKGKRHEV
ncbi:hypothetical protein KIPB_007205, partial [Kipferlia bialata]|eukprot:g7205.t1